jgi:hypothetical protein
MKEEQSSAAGRWIMVVSRKTSRKSPGLGVWSRLVDQLVSTSKCFVKIPKQGPFLKQVLLR